MADALSAQPKNHESKLMTIDVSTTNTDETELPKKPYSAPGLRVYGDIREVTKNMGGKTGMNDGGAGPDKTAP